MYFLNQKENPQQGVESGPSDLESSIAKYQEERGHCHFHGPLSPSAPPDKHQVSSVLLYLRSFSTAQHDSICLYFVCLKMWTVHGFISPDLNFMWNTAFLHRSSRPASHTEPHPTWDHPATEHSSLLRSRHPWDTFTHASPNDKAFSPILQQSGFSTWHQWAPLPTLVMTN